MYIYMHIIITYTVEKKENALIIHSAMETLSEISSFYAYAFFGKFHTPLTQSQLRHCKRSYISVLVIPQPPFN